MYQLTPAFSVPIAIAHLENCEGLNAELRALFLAKESEGDKYRNPTPYVIRNQALFESNFRLFDWPQACIQKLRQFCYDNVYRTIGELNGYDLATLQKLHVADEAWFHLTRRGGFFGAHNHAMHSWSGVYCVSHHGDDPDTDSGKLSLINPHAMNTMYIDMANANMHQPYHMGMRMMRLKPGQLVLFPSWLLHEVLPYDGDDVRITVAFNSRFMLHGAKREDVPIG
jgi:uncharacterized protein (TIGR02466 family)